MKNQEKQDSIKKSALEKLHNFVEFEIKCLEDGGLTLEYFSSEPVEGYFSKEELKEIGPILNLLKKKDGIKLECNIIGIESELLKQ